jgi:hypothetical protein
MTRGELELMNAQIRDAVAAETAPLRAELEQLRSVDRKHSGVHRELGAKVARTQSEVALEQRDLEKAIVLRDERLVHVVNDVADRLERMEQHSTKSIAPAAAGAEAAAVAGAHASLRAEGQAKAISVDTEAIARDQRTALRWWRHPGLYALVYAVLKAGWEIYQASVPSGH